MGGEAVALKSVSEGIGRRCVDDMLRKSIPDRHLSLAEDRSVSYGSVQPGYRAHA